MAVQPSTILGKYRIIREIARSNDIVYEGVDPSMGRRVAIKELAIPQHLSGSQKRERIERFYREAKAAGTLSHPNIVTIFDVGQEGERHFIVMEYLEGHSLREIQQMQGALPVKESLEIALQLCDALGYAHSRGIVHRDVKPDNIHILPGGVIKLTDFGIARITAEPSITAHGQVFGTPSYMSPEQVASHTVDHRTDIFSMGITLYEMLTGRKPFAGDSVITITYNIMNIQPPMPTGVPPGMHSILQKGLAKDVNFRYQNAAAMAADIRAEKFALESGNKTAQMQGMQMPAGGFGGGSMNTGTVPPEISGIPAFAPGQARYGAPTNQGYPPPPQQPGRPYPTQYPGYSPDNRQGGMSSETKNIVVLALSVAGILILLGLIIWGLSVAFDRRGAAHTSSNSQALYQQGAAAFNNGDFATAGAKYDQAMRAAPQTPDADRAALGLSMVEAHRGMETAKTGDLDGAAAAYQHAIDLDPKNAAAYDGMGDLKAARHDTAGAVQSWEAAIQANGQDSYGIQARHSASAAYADMGDILSATNPAEARADWQKAVNLDPGGDAAARAGKNLSAAPQTASTAR